MSDRSIVADQNLMSYFYEHVNDVHQQGGAELDEHTEFYLVNLLVEFFRTGNLVESGGRRVDDLPMAIRLLEATRARPAERYRELKHLADTTLYVLGWFTESVARSTVDRSYYASLGEVAYHRLSTLSPGSRRRAEDPVFRELAQRFEEAVSIVAAVREQSLVDRGDVVALYEQWLQTGSPRIAARLRELGVVLKTAPRKPFKIIH